MEAYQKFMKINEVNQSVIDDTRRTYLNIDKEEESLREVISFHHNELDNLNKEYNNIIETYCNIIRSLGNQ